MWNMVLRYLLSGKRCVFSRARGGPPNFPIKSYCRTHFHDFLSLYARIMNGNSGSAPRSANKPFGTYVFMPHVACMFIRFVDSDLAGFYADEDAPRVNRFLAIGRWIWRRCGNSFFTWTVFQHIVHAMRQFFFWPLRLAATATRMRGWNKWPDLKI